MKIYKDENGAYHIEFEHIIVPDGYFELQQEFEIAYEQWLKDAMLDEIGRIDLLMSINTN